MIEPLQQISAELETDFAALTQRTSDGFAQDVRESIQYWCALARSASEGDTRIDYPVRSKGQLEWTSKLESALNGRSVEEQQLYRPILARAAQLLQLIGQIQTPKEGYLGILSVVHDHCHFLQTEYPFVVSEKKPTGVRFSSGAVYIRLEHATKSYLSCQFGAEPESSHFFCIEDLLFMHNDSRYRSIPESLNLDTRHDLNVWIHFIADVFKQYGHDVLSNEPGVFDRLKQAQASRDAEYVAAMNERHQSGQS